MFEHYNEKARRAIFFARYEASQFGSPYIETEHLLLGLLREDITLRNQLSQSGVTSESLRKQIESERPVGKKVSISVDLPLSHESKLVLAYATEEARALNEDVVNPGHLVLGLLRIKDSLAATLLRQHAIDHDGYREILRAPADQVRSVAPLRPGRQHPPAHPDAWSQLEGKQPAAASLRTAITTFEGLLGRAVDLLDFSSEQYGQQQLKRKPWSRKEALGHLIDLATTHHQWFARVLVEPQLTVAARPQDEWVPAQQYNDLSWPDLVDLWLRLNHLLFHLLLLIPEEKVNIACRIGIEEPVPLLKLIARYIEHCDDIMGQILSRL